MAIAGDAGIIEGTDAADDLMGSDGSDLFLGGLGDDALDGGIASDTYVYGLGDGNDTITDIDFYGEDTDTLALHGVAPGDVVARRSDDGDSLLLALPDGAVITIASQFNNIYSGIERIVFDDGTIWSWVGLIEAAGGLEPQNAVNGTDDDDTLEGTDGNDRFAGGLGDDVLSGDLGSDLYIHAAGEGNDIIIDEDGWRVAADILQLADVNAADVTLFRNETDLFVRIDSTGEELEIRNQFWSVTEKYGIEEIRFADGGALPREAFFASAWYRGTAGDDFLFGSRGDDNIIAGDGDDAIYGSDGNDLIIGGAGADWIDGGAGIDVVSFATAGDGILVDMSGLARNRGDAAGDTYVDIEKIIGSDFDDRIIVVDDGFSVAAGAGDDVVSARGIGSLLDGGDGHDVLNGSVGLDLLYGAAGDDRIRGGNGSDRIFGGEGDDSLSGGSGDDAIFGENGDDFISGDAGADAIDGGTGVDIVSYAASAAAVAVDLLAGTGSGADAEGDTYTGIERAIGSGFDDRLSGDNRANLLIGGDGGDELIGNGGRDSLRGDAGNDTLDGGMGDDRLFGGTGDDRLRGGSGADIFMFGDPHTDAGEMWGRDEIIDFEVGADRIDMSPACSPTSPDTATSTLTKTRPETP
ncbi:MAG: calcium-binding protein [Hyphomicrobiales bacterium]